MESAFRIPHVYYSVSELSAVKDATIMTNTKIKTIGYLYKKDKIVLKESLDSSIAVAVDLTHIDSDVVGIYPYIIFGVLCTISGAPVVVVKFLKRFDSSEADLDKYKKQCLLLRDRLSQYDDILSLAKFHNWI